MTPRFASFSRKQQQVWAVVCLVYGIWVLVSAWYPQQNWVGTPLLHPDPPEVQFYLDPPVDINSATAEELQLLPAIGPVLAKRIVNYRAEHGSFPSINALDDVYGIGPKTLEKLQYYLQIEDRKIEN